MAKVVAPAQNLSRLLASMSWSALLPGVRLFIYLLQYPQGPSGNTEGVNR